MRDAVYSEPVSPRDFPAFREICREILKIWAFSHCSAPAKALNSHVYQTHFPGLQSREFTDIEQGTSQELQRSDWPEPAKAESFQGISGLLDQFEKSPCRLGARSP